MPRRVETESSSERHHLPQAVVKRATSAWLYWLIPLGALALCGWFVYRDFIGAGPTITLYFQSADGVEEKNTQLHYRGATVGAVKNIALTKDSQQVKLTLQMTSAAKNLARAGSQFWIVRPEVSIGSISGLRTIISGEYLEIRPGAGPGTTNVFTGLEKAPLEEEPGALQIKLVTDNLGSMEEESPVFYRGIQVGEVTHFQLAPDSRSVTIHARIRKEYAPLVRTETKFWNAGGFDIHVGLLHGLEMSAQTMRTVVSGGIEFATPPNAQTPAADETTFALNAKAEEVWKTWAPEINLQLPKAAQTNATPNLQPGAMPFGGK